MRLCFIPLPGNEKYKNATVIKLEPVQLYHVMLHLQFRTTHAGLHITDAMREYGEFMGISSC